MADREKLIELIDKGINSYHYCRDERWLHEGIADYLIANGVTIQKKGYWINIPPYRASDGNYHKAQECPICHAFYVSNPNTPYSNHPYCAECGSRLLPEPPKGE